MHADRTLRERVKAPEAARQAPLFEQPSPRMVELYHQHRDEFPWVYRELLELAHRAHGKGWKRMGIAALFEILRWERGPRPKDDQGFKLNNTLRSMYARALMTEPGLEGFFEIRRMRAL